MSRNGRDPLRVLYLSHFGGLGGAERSLLELMVAVRGLGVEPALLCPSGALREAAAAEGIAADAWSARPLTRASPRRWPRSAPGLLRGWAEVDGAIARHRPHVVHANSTQAMLWTGPVARLRGRPLVWHWRDFYSFRGLMRTIAHGASAIVAISGSVQAFAAEMLGASAARRLVTVRNGVADVPPCDPRTAAGLRREMEIPPDAPLVVMAGQSVPAKGHGVLLRALARLAEARPALHAWLICSELHSDSHEHTARLRREALALGCEGRVRISAGCAGLGPALQAADVVAVPSLREPFGRIAVEAMLLRRPVVASAVDGLREIVEDGVTGVLVPPGDPASLADGLARALDTSASRAGEAGRQRALRLFSIDRAAAETLAVYGAVR